MCEQCEALQNVTAENFSVRRWHANGARLPADGTLPRDKDGRTLLCVIALPEGPMSLWADDLGVLLFLALSDVYDEETAARAILARKLAN